MTPEQATFLLNTVCLPQIQNEQKTTRRVIEAVPADKSGYKPDPKAMSAFELASHIASSECFFMNGVASGSFDSAGEPIPESVKTPAQLLEWYDENFAKASARLAGLKPEELTRMINFHGVLNFPAVTYLSMMCSHSIHHRGQLSSYLRPMGSKVPKIYGGSADEPMEIPAQA
ncbi:MAG: DinB family protein [Bryobacteraceae bacterium]|jgi:uncharacterized damage-inducible protein DinB